MLIETMFVVMAVGAQAEAKPVEKVAERAVTGQVVKRDPREVQCTVDEYGFCTDKRLAIELRPDVREVHVPANIALANVLVIWLPSGVVVPKCHKMGKDSKDEVGYCLDSGNPGTFVTEVEEVEGAGRKQGKISIKPVLSAAARAALAARVKIDPNFMAEDIIAGERGNIQFSADRWTVNVDLVVGPAEKAVRQIVLSAPALEKEFDELGQRCQERNAEEYRKLQDAWVKQKAEAAENVGAELAYNVLRSRRCRYAHWTVFRDQLWVEADSICEIGDYRFITFRIRNRAGGGDRFRPGEIGVSAMKDKVGKKIDSKGVFVRESEPRRKLSMEELELGKDDEVIGAVEYDAQAGSGSVSLRIVEAGGKGRVLSVDDIGF